MSKLIPLSFDLIIFILIVFVSVQYWNRNLKKKHLISESNQSYSLFLLVHIISIFVIVFMGNDPQNEMYLNQFNTNSISTHFFWELTGIKLFSYLISYFVSIVFSFFLFKVSKLSTNKLFDLVESNQWDKILVFGGFLITISLIISHFILRPFVFEWLSSLAPMIPLN